MKTRNLLFAVIAGLCAARTAARTAIRSPRLKAAQAVCLVALLAILLSACQRRDMFQIDDGLYMDITLSRNVAFTDTNALKLPEVMTTTFFDVVSGREVVTDYLKPPVAPVYVPGGTYDCLLYNFATEYNIVERATERDSAYVHTSKQGGNMGNLFSSVVRFRQSIATKADFDPSTLNMPLINQPEPFWIGRGTFDLPTRYEGSEELHLKVHGTVATSCGRLTVKRIGGAKYVNSVQVFLTNLASGLYLWSGEPINQPVAINFEASVNSNDESADLVGTFTSYGKLPDEALADPDATRRNEVYLIITDTGGKQHLFVYDVTEKVKESINLELDIVLEVGETDIDIPEPDPGEGGGGGGFSPTVSEWDEEVIHLNL